MGIGVGLGSSGLVGDLRSSVGKNGGSSDRMFDGRAGPFAGQCGPFSWKGGGNKGAPGVRGDKRGSFEGKKKGAAPRDGVPSKGGAPDRLVRVMPSIDTEVSKVRVVFYCFRVGVPL